MSYYYNYYLGYIDKNNNKIYPYGPYTSTKKDNLSCVMNYSRSFDDNFSDFFDEIPRDMYSSELMTDRNFKEAFEENYCPNPKYCRIANLPASDFIKSGYFLIEDVTNYMTNKDSEVFLERVDPIAYNGMVASELKFGKPERKMDDFGEEYTPYSASDYMFFAYPDYNCVEYRAFLLKQFLNSMEEFEDTTNKEFVVLETEG